MFVDGGVEQEARAFSMKQKEAVRPGEQVTILQLDRRGIPLRRSATRRARIGWGRDRYMKRIDLLLEVEEISERTREAANAARDIMQQLLSMSEAPSVAKAASMFVAKFAHVRNDIDAMAREGLRRMLDELASVADPSPAVFAAPSPRKRGEGEWWADEGTRLSEAVRNLHVSASNPRPGFLHVAPVRAGGWSARSRMFDIEREAIGIPIVGDRPHRSTEQFHRLLGRASNRQITPCGASSSFFMSTVSIRGI